MKIIEKIKDWFQAFIAKNRRCSICRKRLKGRLYKDRAVLVSGKVFTGVYVFKKTCLKCYFSNKICK